ncbi:MAG TPA: YraN family protein [Gammaproteobacteria bacterium]|nr:YraN family protein [Gammaproteobacteria bacterium]
MQTSNNSQQRLKTITRGVWAEEQANQYLQAKGLQLITKNYRCKCGEIDLVMRQKDSIVFIEVRYRKNNIFGSAAESIDRRKQSKLIAAAKHYLQSNKITARSPSRIDVIAITGQTQIEWIQNAI